MAKASESRSNDPKKGAAPRRRATTSRAPGKPDGDLSSRGAAGAETTGAGTQRQPMARPADAPSHDAVAERAYQLYQSRGGEHGADLEDWLRAEEELRTQRRKAS
jgi:hypothetical protein